MLQNRHAIKHNPTSVWNSSCRYRFIDIITVTPGNLNTIILHYNILCSGVDFCENIDTYILVLTGWSLAYSLEVRNRNKEMYEL